MAKGPYNGQLKPINQELFNKISQFIGKVVQVEMLHKCTRVHNGDSEDGRGSKMTSGEHSVSCQGFLREVTLDSIAIERDGIGKEVLPFYEKFYMVTVSPISEWGTRFMDELISGGIVLITKSQFSFEGWEKEIG